MAELLRFENVSKIYHMGQVDIHALREVNLSIGEGEFVAVMGPSGSGKSTMMHILGCLDRPTAGHFFVDAEEATVLSKDALAGVRNRKIGFVFQSFNLLPRTTALENVELPVFYSAREQNGSVKKRALELLRRVGLEGREHHFPNQLSGGQQQRVAIARSLMNRPRLVLADEPTGNLDTKSSAEIMALLEELHREGITVVIVTHEAEVAAHAKRVIVMRDGEIVEDRRN